MGQSTELLRLYAGSIVVAMFLPSCSGTVLLKELEMAPTQIPAALLAIALWVARHHAVIERTRDEEFVITDLSGKDGNGVRINGARLPRARLADGDVIELGRTRLKFESTPA